jgi:hypothetical protein
MKNVLFKDFFFDFFIEWEKNQPGRRSTYTAFARWLSDNPYKVTFKQQLISDWIKGKYEPSDERYLLVLAEKLGFELYSHIKAKRPNSLQVYVDTHWESLPLEEQQRISTIVAKYTKDPLPNETPLPET